MSLSIITLDLLQVSDNIHFPDSDENLKRFLVALEHAKRRVAVELDGRELHRIESGKEDAHIPSNV